MRTIKGTALAPGIAHGKAFVIACTEQTVAARRSIDPAEVPHELDRFDTAVAQAERDLRALEQRIREEVGGSEADIFGTQALVAADPGFRDQVHAAVRDRRRNAEAAVAEVTERFTRAFDEIPDPYLRERAADVRDVGRRILTILTEGEGAEAWTIPEDAIIVAEELLPSATARLELNHARAFVTERGGKFAHAAILARSLGTPAVGGIGDAMTEIKTGDRLIVDGVSGLVFVDPETTVEHEYDRLEGEMRTFQEELRELIDLPSVSIAPAYQPLHPAVLQLIQSVAEVARSARRELTICGEMAGNPRYTVLLIGLGLRSFSVAPGEMLAVKNALRGTRIAEAESLARQVLELASVAEIEAMLGTVSEAA